jgi:hypothetical protein
MLTPGRGPAPLPPGPTSPHRARLDASGSYPSSDEAQAATSRGMRGTRWIGGPHAEDRPPFLAATASSRSLSAAFAFPSFPQVSQRRSAV